MEEDIPPNKPEHLQRQQPMHDNEAAVEQEEVGSGTPVGKKVSDELQECKKALQASNTEIVELRRWKDQHTECSFERALLEKQKEEYKEQLQNRTREFSEVKSNLEKERIGHKEEVEKLTTQCWDENSKLEKEQKQYNERLEKVKREWLDEKSNLEKERQECNQRVQQLTDMLGTQQESLMVLEKELQSKVSEGEVIKKELKEVKDNFYINLSRSLQNRDAEHQVEIEERDAKIRLLHNQLGQKELAIQALTLENPKKRKLY
jgi:chromosome segregation ATPase